MLRRPFFWLVAMSALLIFLLARFEAPVEEVDEPLPKLRLTAADGQALGPDWHRGKPWILLVWLPGCAPCERVLPHLEAVRRDYESKGLGVLTVSILDEPDDAVKELRRIGAALPLATVTEDIVESLQLKGVPGAVFIDASGRIVGRVKYGVRSKRFFAARAEELVARR